jgi:hypothetical protein
VARALISGSKIFEFQLGTLAAAFAISIVYFLADYFNLSARVMLDIIYAFVISIEVAIHLYSAGIHPASEAVATAVIVDYRDVIESDYLAG